MRLKKIKLAGFKSFVDPTTVNLPGNLVGIVGPNGCGKSNVIDAVRWVMGESSAKYLRGESMTDVIFNGSNSRKPVSHAAIELVFDNTDGTLGGQYAGYAEISVKRQVNREGQSQYILNGTRCRRRDITDVFLGTGLGPRSYAIIEQGMISRIIEARPEDLRVYLEEAAGISLYKERRKETSRRIRDTRDNMERLNDLRDEVGSQLEKLKRQAQTAERYKALKKEERQLRAELLALRLTALDGQLRDCRQQIAEHETELESCIAGQRAAERGLVEAREQQRERGEAMNAIQGRYYGLGSDLARIEQQIAHQRELRNRHEEDTAANARSLAEVTATLEQDREKLTILEQRLEELQPRIEEAEALEEEASDAMVEAQERLDDWQQRWDTFNSQSAESLQSAQVERTRIEGLEQSQHDLQRRRQRLRQELEGLQADSVEEALHQLGEQHEVLLERRENTNEALEQADQRLAGLGEQEDELGETLHELRGELQRKQARLASLETLQQSALGEDDQARAAWIADQGLAADQRLASRLQVIQGWEQAVELVLGERLQALLLDGDSQRLASADQSPPGGRLLLLQPGMDVQQAVAGDVGLPRLLDKVTAPWPMDDLLGGVYCADNLDQALAARPRLAAHESVLLADGRWFGQRWLSLGSTDASDDGVLARERAMQELRQAVTDAEVELADLVERQRGVSEQRSEAAERQAELREERDSVAGELVQVESRLESRRQRLAEVAERRDGLTEELERLAEQDEDAAARLRAARRNLQEALDRGEALDEQRDALQAEREQAQAAVIGARERMRGCREQRHDLSLRLENARTARHSIAEHLQRLEEQHQRLKERERELEQAFDAESDPERALSGQRETLLAQRVEVERELNLAREGLAAIDEQLRRQDASRIESEQAAERIREALEAARLHEQEHKVRRQTQAEQLLELGFDLETLQENLPPGAEEARWLERLSAVEQSINRLGSINLAAIEEHDQLAERKSYLDQQQEDLTQALETLESAIRKIDRETRTRFKDTFERVNAGLKNMYPRLFGGGEAYLELTDDDLLETGVTIMARPPGKRISNIHLLSGGEKALTAVALIFAIFELNPAPFCMLDEVDAPLDEANVGRFSQLVKEMSNRVQFIFITHNKTTMEIAGHLMGVTMHEAGVSRLVAVDVDEAADMAVA